MTAYGAGALPVDLARTLLIDGFDLLHGVRREWESLDVVIKHLEPVVRAVYRNRKGRLTADAVAKVFGFSRKYFAYEYLPKYGITWRQLSVWRPGLSLRQLAGLPDRTSDKNGQPGAGH